MLTDETFLSNFLYFSYIFFSANASLPCQLQERKLVAEIKRTAKTGNEVSMFVISHPFPYC